jgi:hypothetical protein
MAARDKKARATVTEYRPTGHVWDGQRISRREAERRKEARQAALLSVWQDTREKDFAESKQTIRLWPAIAVSLSIWLVVVFVFWWAFL